jgi:phenylalanyl-tRNA synthetase alpha chain
MDLEKLIRELSTLEKKVLLVLEKLHGQASPEAIFKEGDFSQDVEVMNAASWLQSKNLIHINEQVHTVYALGAEGEEFIQHGLPERRALQKIVDLHGTSRLQDLVEVLKPHEIPVAIGWLKQKGWATISKKGSDTIFSVTELGRSVIGKDDDDEKILRHLSLHPNSDIDKEKYRHLVARKNVVKEKEIVSGHIQLTELGTQVIHHGIIIQEEISQISDKVIKERSWEKIPIRPYDISAFAPKVYGGKLHPLTVLIEDIRQIFLEMGFQEITGDFVESCFWNMDVLFIPQDHPAREMQDTFYCKTPSQISINDDKLLDRIAQVHYNGGSTGSDGWGYDFSKDEGKRALLRTHTTVNTIRYLYEHPIPPAKIFSIGQVFRKENIDVTHLPVFYQIEGIIFDDHANFRQLLGIIFEFYKRMGFEKIRFRPAYFPYTEPSMEIEVFWNDKWMELGGSGIFRPEVTKPIGISSPVLAWGLGLERIAMLKFGLRDIRQLYQSDFDWLRNTPL